MIERLDENWVMKRRNLNNGLQHIRTVLAKYGNPQEQYQVIHVSGTNGKGSTCQYLANILETAGFRVGLFTSPHLQNHRDRIRINGEWIPHDTYMKYLHEMEEDIMIHELGMFEIVTVIAYRYFADQQLDYAIIECGLGGRLDSTNVITRPKLCLITSIGSDHMEILGNRPEQIAFEKAGILTKGSKCITHELPDNIQNVIHKVARRKQASLMKCYPYRILSQNTCTFDGDLYTMHSIATYQYDNVSLALTAAKYLGVDIHRQDIKDSIRNTSWPGRFEKVCKKPCVYIDGAHNKEGIDALVQSFDYLQKPIHVVFSALKDKPVRSMAYTLQKNCDVMYITQFENERIDTLEHLSMDGAIVIPNYQDAIHTAMQNVRENGTVVITGSLYFISIVREYFQNQNVLSR